MKFVLVGVLGASEADERLYGGAVELGSCIARRGWWVICGGLGGVMEGVCRGAVESEGYTIGVLPGLHASEANPWVRIPIVTGMADARNTIIARTAQVCVAMPGSHGTLSEIAFCLKFGTPVVGYRPKGCPPLPHSGIDVVETAVAACEWVSQRV